MYATRLLDTLIDFSDKGLVLRSLSPSSVMVDESGVGVKVLVLPLAYNVDRQYAAAAGRNGRPVANEELLRGYMQHSQYDPITQACLPLDGEMNETELISQSTQAWDVYSYGATLFTLAFGIPPPPAHQIETHTGTVMDVEVRKVRGIGGIGV